MRPFRKVRSTRSAVHLGHRRAISVPDRIVVRVPRRSGPAPIPSDLPRFRGQQVVKSGRKVV